MVETTATARGRLVVVAIAALLAGCGPATTDPTPRSRTVSGTVAVGSDGSGRPFSVDIPAGTRSISILVAGRNDAHYALSSLVFSDEVDVVGYPSPTQIQNELTRLATEQELMVSPTGFVQESRRGVYSLTVPFAPGQSVPAGPGRLTIISSVPDHDVEVEVKLSPDDGSRVLRVDIYSVDDASITRRVQEEVDEIYRQADIEIRWETFEVTESLSIDRLDELPLSPVSPPARVVEQAKRTDPSGLSVFVFPALPDGVSGLSLSIPAPHDPRSPMTGIVLVPLSSPIETARVLAHEIGHQLGLRHLETRSTEGVLVANPIDDTFADAQNLMQFGTHLTPGQIDVVHASPYLEASP